MSDTAFSVAGDKAARVAEPLPDKATGQKPPMRNLTRDVRWHSGGGGLAGTARDYLRFCQMLLNGGVLDGERIIGRKTLQLMASDHLGPHVKVDSPLMPPGHGFGLGFAVRTQGGIAPFMGSVGQFFWSGMGGTFFWIDPVEDLFAAFMSQGPGQRMYTRTLARNLVYAALE
jgi:CubicO group peptidase (beta-lactamase class C family)